MVKPALVILCIFFYGCQSKYPQGTLSIISEKIGDNAVIDYNPDRTFALVQEKLSLLQAEKYTTYYLIIRLSDKDIIKEGKIVEGHIKWINDDIIEIFEMPGVLKDGQNEDQFKKHINTREFLKGKPRK